MADSPIWLKKADPLVGRVIHDRFEIVELLGRGGMGRVYRGVQRPLGRNIALKILDPRYTGEGDPMFKERFFREAAALAKLQHPNTVTVFDYGVTEDEVYFIAMELVDGRTLASILEQARVLPAPRAVGLAVQIARSLREAHMLDLVHRDLKPANVLVTCAGDEEDFVKVLDFGLVKDLDSEAEDLTQHSLFMGSPRYMSPEQIQGEEVDGRSDIYALGALLYQMLTGVVPFVGETPIKILMGHIGSEVTPPRARNPEVPLALEEVVLRCLEKDAVDRYATMEQLIIALKVCLGATRAPMLDSADYPLALHDSGTRRVLAETPSGGFGLTTPAAGYGVPELEEAAEARGRRRRKGASVFLLAAALAGGSAVVATRTTSAPTPIVSSATERPAETTAEAATPIVEVAAPIVEVVSVEAPRTERLETPTEVHRLEVTLRSRPAGATVTVGTRNYGATPASIEWVGALAEVGREVTFRFDKRGYRPTTITRTIIEGEAIVIDARLRRRGGGGSMGGRSGASGDDEGAFIIAPGFRDVY